MKRKICLLALAILFCVPVLAHAVLNSYTFDVYDEDGNALTSGIIVQIQAASGSTAETIYSDPNGKVSLANPITVTGQVKFFYGANTCDVVVYDNPLTTKIKKAGVTPLIHRIVFPKTQNTSQQLATVTFSATGTSTLATVDINAGAIDGTTIGAASAAAGTFSSLTRGAVSDTEFSYLDGVTSAIQTQIDTKLPKTLDVVNKDTDYAILSTDTGKIITNYGATGSRTFTLPTAAAGLVVDVLHTDTDNLKVVKSGSDTILGTSTNSLVIATGTLGGSLRLVATRALQWVITGREDTWTDTTTLP